MTQAVRHHREHAALKWGVASSTFNIKLLLLFYISVAKMEKPFILQKAISILYFLPFGFPPRDSDSSVIKILIANRGSSTEAQIFQL